MEIKLTSTSKNCIEEAIKFGKETGYLIVFERDGEHSTNDLQVVLDFVNAGFKYKIYNYKGRFDEQAIRVEFRYFNK